MRNGDARDSDPEGRDLASPPRQVVRTPGNAAGDSAAMGAADTAVNDPSDTATMSMQADRPASEDSLIGTILLDRYQITRTIGQGGMGVVYEATHTLIGKRMAIKVLLDKYAQKDQIVIRLEQEARRAAAIGHEHIIDITDRGETADGRTFVVMEYLEGESLGQCIQRDGPLPEQRAIRIAHQIADALHAAHEKGILHRDVKPENIFLLNRKGADFIKVVDFGISKAMRTDDEDEGEAQRLTQTGMVLGTPLYMSPEQARGSEDLDRRIDVYSLGVILYEMLTGEVPFHGKNYLHIIAQVLSDEPRPPSEMRPDISQELETIILRALEKDPAERYQSCEEMAADLAMLMETTGRSTSKSRITAARSRRRRAGRRYALKILAWVAGIAVVISAIAVTIRALMGGGGPPTIIIQPPVITAVSRAAMRDAGAPPSPPPGPPPSPPDAARQRVTIAEIEIQSTPQGARLFAGGRELGYTPYRYRTPKDNRTIELIAELDGYDDSQFTINPFVDDGTPVMVRLERPRRGAKVKKLVKKRAAGETPPEGGTGAAVDPDPRTTGTAGGDLRGNPYKRRAE